MDEIEYKAPKSMTNMTQMPTEMHFEKASWWKRLFFNNKLLKQENERLITEHIEWLQKMKDLHLEKEMIKELAKRQAVQIKDQYDKIFDTEHKIKIITEELQLLKNGILPTGKEVKAITLVKTDPKTYAPMVVTMDESATKVITRELLTPGVRKVAVEGAKIAFIEMFDPVPIEELM